LPAEGFLEVQLGEENSAWPVDLGMAPIA
jgi:hypothetical protein